jgi:hypothetical protein
MIILGSVPSFDIVRGKAIQTIEWHRFVHPIMCSMLSRLTYHFYLFENK